LKEERIRDFMIISSLSLPIYLSLPFSLSLPSSLSLPFSLSLPYLSIHPSIFLLCSLSPPLQVPLLDAASEKFDALLKFRDDVAPRVVDLEGASHAHAAAVDRIEKEKESKATASQRMQQVSEQLANKASVEWAKGLVEGFLYFICFVFPD
jgi:hypothetical protein